MSWEWLTEVNRPVSWRYDAVGKPLYSKASGWTRFEPLEDGRTRVHFRETYHVFNPILRFLLERIVHRYISRDNDKAIKRSIERGLEIMRERLQDGRGDTPIHHGHREPHVEARLRRRADRASGRHQGRHGRGAPL